MKSIRLLCILLIGLISACRSNVVAINVNFDHLTGLSEGDRVLFEKEDAGRIRSVAARPDGPYRVALDVREGLSHALTQYSRFLIIDDPGRSGHKAVDIRASRKGGVLLADGATVDGVSPDGGTSDQWRNDLEKGFRFLEGWARRRGLDLQELPDSKSYRDFKQTLREWAAEMDRAGREARKNFERHWLPGIRQGLEDFNRWLRDHEREENRHPPAGQGDRIRNV
jgi:hypothetical protein